jgi:hypothetical protein
MCKERVTEGLSMKLRGKFAKWKTDKGENSRSGRMSHGLEE